MASDLMSIARSGTRVARAALDVTASNIANAASAGYVRRSASIAEVVVNGTNRAPDLAGARIGGVTRSADPFRQAEVRRTGADAARAGAELAGLTGIETALEQSGLHDSVVGFEAALARLASDPVDPALRAALIEDTRTLTHAFHLAAGGLEAVGEGLRFEASGAVDRVNSLTGELARINQRLVRVADGSTDRSALLDQRDLLLEELSGHIGIATSIAPDQSVEVRLGGTTGPVMVSGGTASTMAMATAGDGTISFTLDGNPAVPSSGDLAGKAQALVSLGAMRGELDTLAAGLIATVNAAQANGAALDGSPGQPLLTGTGAADMALGFEAGALIATAPAGSPAGSRDSANLSALRSSLTAADPAGGASALLFGIASAVSGRTVTSDALNAIADGARSALGLQAAVDLDQEAVNLIRFQQAFQASGRVMQVASDIFDSILAIR